MCLQKQQMMDQVGPSQSAIATHVGDQDVASVFRLCHGLSLAVIAIWEVNQQLPGRSQSFCHFAF